MDIAVLTFAALPQLDAFDASLLPALAALGLDARPVVWDDPAMDWRTVRMALVRNTWDSHLRREAFVAWAEKVGRLTQLHNPAPVLRWNTHKGYLRELEGKGVPVTPTTWVPQGGALDVGELAGKHGWDAVVLKPAVSAGALGTHRFSRAEAPIATARLAELAQTGDVMVQPYLTAFEKEGERSYVFFDGVFSHAVRRPPTLPDAPRGFAEPTAFSPDNAAELRLAESVLEAVGRPLLYARVDVATDNAGQPRLQELEVTEPRLFLSLAPGAADRLARAIAAKL
ncbi:ATP-grasp domain-containing protein [Myxococcus sp. Y35]|uniref:ATP-grasp domain-containing protein n=1 Tax=Pseudomyxococcus flavus TaxID=3115648 RepID=UPI003CE8D240